MYNISKHTFNVFFNDQGRICAYHYEQNTEKTLSFIHM